MLNRDITILNNKMRFVTYYIEDKIVIKNIKKKDIIMSLKRMNFTMFKDLPIITSTKLQVEKETLIE